MPNGSGGKNGQGQGRPPSTVPPVSASADPEPVQTSSGRKTYGKRGEEGYIGEMGMTVGKFKLPYDLSLEVATHWQGMQTHDPEATLGDALREIIRMGMSAIPEEAVLIAARDRAFTHVRRWAMIRDSAHHREMVADLERELSLEVLRGTPDKR